jgi:hypothetical protein
MRQYGSHPDCRATGKNWRALYAVAKVAGGEWPERARKATAALAVTEDDDETIVVKLLVPRHSDYDSLAVSG